MKNAGEQVRAWKKPSKVYNHHRRLIFSAIAFVQSVHEGNRKFINKLKEREAFN